jgi:3-phenylpropionate/cinnamic acid dioxygenase small subunit
MITKSANRLSDQDHAHTTTSRVDVETTFQVQDLLARYVQALDDDRLEAWPDFFTDNCRYVVTTAENVAQGMPLGMIYATSRAMLRDRVRSLRDANVYEAQRYRHMIGPPVIERGEGGVVHAQTSFMVVRIMHTGETMLFVTGRYDDRIRLDGPDAPRFVEKAVVLDSRQIDTLLAIPI